MLKAETIQKRTQEDHSKKSLSGHNIWPILGLAVDPACLLFNCKNC